MAGQARAPAWAESRITALRATKSAEEIEAFIGLTHALEVELAQFNLTDVEALSGSPISLNVVRKVRTADQQDRAKLALGARQGEVATLAAWNAAQLACPKVIRWESRPEADVPSPRY